MNSRSLLDLIDPSHIEFNPELHGSVLIKFNTVTLKYLNRFVKIVVVIYIRTKKVKMAYFNRDMTVCYISEFQ
jgi:hypothetical protein